MRKINVVLTPEWDGEKVPSLNVNINAEIDVKENKEIFWINEVTIFKPFTRLKEAISVTDKSGRILYKEENEQQGPVKLRKYIAKRAAEGTIDISYTLLLDAAGKNPVFDLGWEKGGMTGAGMTFMPRFEQGSYEYTIIWNMDKLPQDCIGVWSFGEGKVTKVGGEGLLMDTFYAAGLMDSVRFGNFSYYWMSNSIILPLAVTSSQIFQYESKFFHDAGEKYTIFTRHTDSKESKRAGGTALERSYMYLYLNNEQLDPSWIKFLFAHEMVHNWVQMDNTPFGICTWYIEGMAEYYSALLPWRMGIVTKEELCKELNKRAAQYYENPCISCTDMESGGKLMADPEMTRIPYGRGFFYLLHADGMIRMATKGERCLDDVMLALLERSQKGEKLGNEDWFKEYGDIVGVETARAEHKSFSNGGEVVPDAACYEGAIKLEKTVGKQRETDKECTMWKFV
jgi:hypothetical protein